MAVLFRNAEANTVGPINLNIAARSVFGLPNIVEVILVIAPVSLIPAATINKAAIVSVPLFENP